MKTFVFAAALAVLCCGCGPGKEVQYLQAAEQVKAEEAKLAKLTAVVDSHKKALDANATASRMAAVNLLEESKKELGKIRIREGKGGSFEEQSAPLKKHFNDEAAKMVAAYNEKGKEIGLQMTKAMFDVKEQQAVVDAAIERRDSLAGK